MWNRFDYMTIKVFGNFTIKFQVFSIAIKFLSSVTFAQKIFMLNIKLRYKLYDTKYNKLFLGILGFKIAKKIKSLYSKKNIFGEI